MATKEERDQLKILEQRVNELETRTALYERILACLPLGIQVFDEKGFSFFINDKQGELLGLPDLTTGIGAFNVLTDPYALASGAAEIYSRAYAGRDYEHTYEYHLGIQENQWNTRSDSRIFDEKLIPLKDLNQKVEYVLAILEDVTDKKRIENGLYEREKQLEELNATKDKLFSIIAHDLRSPFNALIGLNELVSMKIDTNDPASAKRLLDLIRGVTIQALNLLDNLLQWSRLQTGSLEFNPVPFDFKAMTDELLSLLEANFKEKSLDIQVAIEPDLHLRADRLMVETILRNLIANAIKFTNMGGGVRIIAHHAGQDVEISVTDNGRGIPREQLDHLFDIKSNYTSSGTQQEKGSGLGLVLCKEFVEQHGGHIWVESRENDFTRFTFSIPQQVDA